MEDMLTALGKASTDVHSATAWTSDPAADARYDLTVIRVEGVEARNVMTRWNVAELRALGISDHPETLLDLATVSLDVTSLIVTDGREVFINQAEDDTTFGFLVPRGRGPVLARRRGRPQHGRSTRRVAIGRPDAVALACLPLLRRRRTASRACATLPVGFFGCGVVVQFGPPIERRC
jgi:hypothetical protein